VKDASKAPPERGSALFCLRNSAPLAGSQFGQHLIGLANLVFRSGSRICGIKGLACPIAVIPR
jgi:hypothetical protein